MQAETLPVATFGREEGGACKHRVGCPYQVSHACFPYSCEFQPGRAITPWRLALTRWGSARGLWSCSRRQKIRIQRQARGADQHKARDPGMDCFRAGEPLAMFLVSPSPGRWGRPAPSIERRWRVDGQRARHRLTLARLDDRIIGVSGYVPGSWTRGLPGEVDDDRWYLKAEDSADVWGVR